MKSKHQGSHLSHSTVLQEGFHIEGGKRLIKKYIKSCVICKKLRFPLSSQLMADLPSDRSAKTPPFSDVGIDVFGPFHITRDKATRRSSGTAKMWVVIFVCLPSHAIHLEPLPSLDTPSFRNALSRFISLRGTCRLLRSDCGSNFIGARRQL